MARKMQLDSSILTDMKAVGADSFKDSILMIEVEKIKPSIDNFYSMDEIEMLAEDIERQGLKHNLVVTEDVDFPGTYFIKSGHRRFAAVQFLISENRYTSKFIPCLVDGAKTKSENMLDLIMLNATTRVMTDAELYKQYEILRDVIEQLKQEGKKIKGRLRENVAAFLNVSPAQVGKIENIRHNAVEEVQNAVESGELSIATADKIAKLTEDEQKELIAEHDLSEMKSSDVQARHTQPSDKLPDDETEQLARNEPSEPVESADDLLDTETHTEPDEQEESVEFASVPEESAKPDEEDTAPFLEAEEGYMNEIPSGEPDSEIEPAMTEEEHCDLYRKELMDAMQNFLSTISVAKNMKSIDRAVVRMQSELKNIMGGI